MLTPDPVAVPVFKPHLEQPELDASQQALEMGWLGMGSYVEQFEAALRERIGGDDRHVAAVSTGHAALHLALMVAGVGPGDEVITPSFNNIADFQAILAVGAAPVFADILDDTLCVDPEWVESLIGPKTKAIIAMDYAAALADHGRLQTIADTHGLRLIHDAAHSLGSSWHGQAIGGFSDIAMFSFDPVKTITCIDGGAVVVRNEDELRRIREMRLIGMGQPAEVMYQNQRAWTYDVNRLGFRYHMANLHAAIGLAQIAKLDMITRTRRETCAMFSDRLSQLPAVTTPPRDLTDITPFLYYIRVPAEDRDAMRSHLGERGIDTGIHWQPGHRFTLFRDCRRGALPVTETVADEIMTLPLHSDMAPEIAGRVVEAVESFYGRA